MKRKPCQSALSQNKTVNFGMHGSQLVASEFRSLFHSLMPPCGSVLVAFNVAKKLNAPLDIFVVRKLGVLGHWERPANKERSDFIKSGGRSASATH
jgi:hypothetical protein